MVFPPWIVAPFSLGAWFLATAISADGAALWAGFTLAYVHSDYTHWAVHARPPRTIIGRWNRDRHLAHHFLDTTRGFGVGTALWDWVLGTTQKHPNVDPETLFGQSLGAYDGGELLAGFSAVHLVASEEE